MKEISLFMENTALPYLKKFLLVYVGVILLHTLLYHWNFNEHLSGILILSTLISILILMRLHRSRTKLFMSYGGYNRIRLLPIRKHTFLISELLFVFSTYAGLFAALNIGWIIYALLKGPAFPIQNNTYYFLMLSGDFTAHFAPLHPMTLLTYFLMMLTLTCMTCTIMISKNNDFMNLIFTYFAMSLPFIILSVNFIQYYTMVLAAFLPIHIWLLYKYFYRKGGLSK